MKNLRLTCWLCAMLLPLFACGYVPPTFAHPLANPAVKITEYPIPSSYYPIYIDRGPDGNLWFTEDFGNKIGRITPTGKITEFPLQIPGEPYGITKGPDGSLWFTDDNPGPQAKNWIGRITPSGSISTFPVPTAGDNPHGITVGPVGSLWFCELSIIHLAKITIQ